MINEKPLLAFSSHYSLGQSILTLDPPKKKGGKIITEIDDDYPVSIPVIAERFDIKQTIIVENTFTGYWELYKSFREVGRPYVFGWKVAVATDCEQKDDQSALTESNIIIFLKNSDSYYKIVKWVTKANTTNQDKVGRLSWEDLQELYDPEFFEIGVSFYSGFIARNLLRLGGSAAPKWGKIKPILFIQQQGIPFDNLIKEATVKYAKANKLQMMDYHQCYYYKTGDIEAYQTFRCIQNRSTLQKPELSNFCSSEFSFEGYVRKFESEKINLL